MVNRFKYTNRYTHQLKIARTYIICSHFILWWWPINSVLTRTKQRRTITEKSQNQVHAVVSFYFVFCIFLVLVNFVSALFLGVSVPNLRRLRFKQPHIFIYSTHICRNWQARESSVDVICVHACFLDSLRLILQPISISILVHAYKLKVWLTHQHIRCYYTMLFKLYELNSLLMTVQKENYRNTETWWRKKAKEKTKKKCAHNEPEWNLL